MGDFNISNTDGEKKYNYSNMSFNNTYSTGFNNTYSTGYDNTYSTGYDNTIIQVMFVVEWIIVCLGLPLTLAAIAAVCSLVRKDHVAPIYVINLLMSDLIQLCGLAMLKARGYHFLYELIYFFGIMTSIGFMVCISLERYLMITQPLWYRFRRNIKTSVAVCVVVWLLPLVYALPFYFKYSSLIRTIVAVYFLLPFPLLVFFLVGTIRALSTALSVPADEKRRIVAVLVIVVLNYTLLFLPTIIWYLVEEAMTNINFAGTAIILVHINPFADLTLYVFIRKGAMNQGLASWCCC